MATLAVNVTAKDSGGLVGVGSAVITTTPPVSISGPPLSFDDPMFAGVANSGAVTIPNNGSLVAKSITATGGEASIKCNGAATITRTRVNSREAVRVVSGLIRIDQCWLEAKGIGADHADVIQTYSPGSTGTIHVTSSTIRAYNQAATAGIFVADDWIGTVRLENVLFWSGPYGLRVHPGVGGDAHVYMKDVFFVGPFAYARYLFSPWGGHQTIIHQWENVRDATIINGVLVPGATLPRP